MDQDDVVTIIELFNRSVCRELRFRDGEVQLALRKAIKIDDKQPTVRTSLPSGLAPIGTASAAPLAPPTTSPVSRAPSVPGTEIKSPMLGIFYRSPSPDAPPFVEVGQKIEAGATLCIIEVMKVMNTVRAERSGRISAVYPENATMVEFNETIMVIKEDASE
ncbi:acetyl-CoA carboxylase biotin carboxyl carrier protein [Bradyrhizobium canariense]|nr:acetyl-CoA carboxylase biotin carboxyl carrier protein [Bradyrhizobium canariense]